MGLQEFLANQRGRIAAQQGDQNGMEATDLFGDPHLARVAAEARPVFRSVRGDMPGPSRSLPSIAARAMLDVRAMAGGDPEKVRAYRAALVKQIMQERVE
jgi:hypothetical protein